LVISSATDGTAQKPDADSHCRWRWAASVLLYGLVLLWTALMLVAVTSMANAGETANRAFYGTFLGELDIPGCASEPFSLTIGDDPEQVPAEYYIYLSGDSSAASLSGYDDQAGAFAYSVQVLDETRLRADWEQISGDGTAGLSLTLDMGGAEDTVEFLGTRSDPDSTICQGRIHGRLQRAFTLTHSVSGDGWLWIDPAGAAAADGTDAADYYTSGSQVQITAEAAPGWVFSGWGGDADDEGETIQVTMDAPKEITAHFVRATVPMPPYLQAVDAVIPPFRLQIMVEGQGRIETDEPVEVNEDGSIIIMTVPNSRVEVTARRADGWVFSGWSGELPPDIDSTSQTITLNMDGDRSITATFSRTDTADSGDTGGGAGGCFIGIL
jgi:hypothetical protein